MSTVNLPANVALYDPAAAAAAAAAKVTNTIGTTPEELQDNFMKMLITQMKNQDPLNPADSSEFTSQLAQLNTAKGIETMNAQFKTLIDQVAANDFLGSANLVGQHALVAGSMMAFNGEKPVAGAASVAANASSVKVSIVDAAGKIVDELDLGPVAAGSIGFAWDGTAADGASVPAGAYQFKVKATAGDGSAIAATTMTSAEVTSVQRTSAGTKLALADGRIIASADVLEWTK